jgi:uncharacterized protein YqiB (DUF1249 family)
MDLGFDVLQRSPDRLIIALSHYYKHPSGDMIADPDMEIAVFPSREYAEALSYQDSNFYHCIESPSGDVDDKLRKNMNAFLSQWLTNLIQQGHCITAYRERQESANEPPCRFRPY